MTFYSTVLLVHSWTRWVVLVAMLTALAVMAVGGLARRPFGDGERKAMFLFVRALEVQVLLGLILYFVLSPLGVSQLGNMATVMKQPALRYYAVEHLFGMLVGIGAAEGLWARARRAPLEKRRGPAFAAVLVPLLVVLGTMPWPSRPYGRPLFRSPGAERSLSRTVEAPARPA